MRPPGFVSVVPLLFVGLIGATAVGARVVGPAAQQPRPAPAGLESFVALPSPAAEGAGQPSLTTDATGRVWMSWLEPMTGGGFTFKVTSLIGAAWTAPITVVEGPRLLANWADFPSVFAAADGTLAAHWLERSATSSGYGIRMRTSSDAGKTWSATQTPHRDDAATAEHGFVSFFDAPGGGIGLAWLDGREAASHMSSAGAMALRATMLRTGRLGEDTLVDPRVCDCCQTSAARTASGAVVAYRDRSDKEIRDISVVAFRNGRWSAPVGVHADGWEISGCPINGPAIAASGQSVAVAWFTRAGNDPRVNVAFSTDEGRTFGPPIRVGDATALGRVGVVMPDGDRALVLALEKTEAGARLVLRDITRNGGMGEPAVVSAATPDRTGGFARIALSGRRVLVAWTDVRPGARSRVAVAASALR